MKLWLKRLALLAACLALCLGAARAEQAFTGQGLTTFIAYYSENVYFINDSTGYHLLPLILTQQDSGAGDGRVTFRLPGDTLALEGSTGRNGETIERCTLTLTAPSGMQVGNAVYNDFVISAYQCYALLMAMEGGAQPAERYAVVDLIERAVAEGEGTGAVQRGVYTLTGVKAGNVVTLTYENNTAVPDPTPVPAEDATGDSPDEDAPEGAPEGEQSGVL